MWLSVCVCAMSSISWYLLHLASAGVQVPRVGQGRQGGDGGGLVEGLLVLELLAPDPEGKSPKKWDVIRREVCRVGFDQRNPKPETDC